MNEWNLKNGCAITMGGESFPNVQIACSNMNAIIHPGKMGLLIKDNEIKHQRNVLQEFFKTEEKINCPILNSFTCIKTTMHISRKIK